MANRTATTLSKVPLRGGAGAEYEAQSLLDPGTTVRILNEQGDWLEVRAKESEGFIARQMVLLSEQQVSDGFLLSEIPAEQAKHSATTRRRRRAGARSEAATVPMEPPPWLRISVGPQPSASQKLAANTWNRYGALLAHLAAALNFDPGVAVSVFGIESGGRGFAPDGRMIIRFETHIFFEQWGKRNLDTFNRHFRFNPTQRWKDHQWRPSTNGPWRDFHGRQTTEWEAFEFARTVDDRASKLSISMGGPQIMGFNHASIGYETVHQMFDAFSAGERSQVIGFFDFVKGPSGSSRRVVALQDGNFEAFAELYNGSGMGKVYAGKMRLLFDAFQSAWMPLRTRRVNADSLNLRRTPEIRADNIVRELPRTAVVLLSVAEPVREMGRAWVKVRVDGQEGWVSGAFLDPVVT